MRLIINAYRLKIQVSLAWIFVLKFVNSQKGYMSIVTAHV